VTWIFGKGSLAISGYGKGGRPFSLNIFGVPKGKGTPTTVYTVPAHTTSVTTVTTTTTGMHGHRKLLSLPRLFA